MAFIITGTGSRSAESWDNSGTSQPKLVIEYAEIVGGEGLVGTTTTDANGFYSFNDLIPDDYYVEFILPNGYSFSPQDQGGDDALDSDANTSTGKTIITTLINGENDLTWDAGMHIPPAKIGNYVWNDADHDGIQDGGELGIENVTVNLYKSDDTPAGSTTTNSSGIYAFPVLDPGDYYVEFILPSNYTFSLPDQGGDDALDSDANIATGKTITTSLESDETDDTWDAGMYYVPPPPDVASIGDYVWLDADADGIQDGGELGIENVTVNLYESDDTPADNTTTNSSGVYSFTDLTPGDYYVEFILPNGYQFSPMDQGGDDAVDSDANVSTGKTTATNLIADENDITWDAGMYYQPASIGNYVWLDDR